MFLFGNGYRSAGNDTEENAQFVTLAALSGSQVDVSYCVNGFRADSCHKSGTPCYGCSGCTCHGTGFYLLFSKVSKLLWSDVWFRFNKC